MEEEMAEDIVNEDEVEHAFAAYEVDLDYEFDAARFVDFCRPELPLEARQAEVWFDSAGSYPPSPFVARLVPREEILMGSTNISPKSKGVENMNLSASDSDIEVDCGVSAPDMEYTVDDGQDKRTSATWKIGSTQNIENPFQNLPSGLSFCSHPLNNKNSQNHAKLSMKPSFPRASTLMKPTASQLANQNRPIRPGYSRSNTSIFEKKDKSSACTSGIENQAAKRQKLEGGLLRKVVGAVQLQQTIFVHKAAKRGLLDVNRIYAKPRITIPREPDLETAHRAQRTRPKSSKENDNEMPTVHKFKAHPLNKKILEAPSLFPKRSTPRFPDFQEFHFKTSERAMQYTSVLKSNVPSNNSVKALNNHATNLTEREWTKPSRPAVMSTSRVDGGEPSHTFKAIPLNKKILTSKGDIGVFLNSKETTVPMEFNFQTEKRSHLNPPIELFGKLLLSSETQPIPNSESQFPWSAGISAKVSKENRWGHFQQTNEGERAKLQDNVVDVKNKAGITSGTKWSKGIR